MLGDVSSDIKCRGEGNGLGVITQSCWCRQEWRVGVVEEVVTVNKQGSLSETKTSAWHHSAECIQTNHFSCLAHEGRQAHLRKECILRFK